MKKSVLFLSVSLLTVSMSYSAQGGTCSHAPISLKEVIKTRADFEFEKGLFTLQTELKNGLAKMKNLMEIAKSHSLQENFSDSDARKESQILVEAMNTVRETKRCVEAHLRNQAGLSASYQAFLNAKLPLIISGLADIEEETEEEEVFVDAQEVIDGACSKQ